MGAHIDYARETGEILYYNKLDYTGIGSLPMPERQEDKNGESNTGPWFLNTMPNWQHHMTKAVCRQGNRAVLPTRQCREVEATGMSGNGRRDMKCAVGTKR